MTTFSKVLIDGDVIICKAGFASESSKYFVGTEEFRYKKNALEYMKVHGGEIIKVREAFPEHICHKIIDNLIQSILDDLHVQHFSIVMGAKGPTFRHKLATTAPYKGNRKASSKPLLYESARKYLQNKCNVDVVEGVEADDVLGILQSEDTCTIIASIDKDLLMIPGYHFNINSKEVIVSTDPGSLTITKSKVTGKLDLKGTGFKWFCAQMLLGDAVDNIIKPKKGLGPRKVFNLLDPLKTKDEMFNKIKEFYPTEERLHENAQLLWIWRTWDDTYKNHL